jgi:hypothetical protein
MLFIVMALLLETNVSYTQTGTAFDNTSSQTGASNNGVTAPSFTITFSSLDTANVTYSEWKPQLAYCFGQSDTGSTTLAYYFSGAAADSLLITIQARMNGSSYLVYPAYTCDTINGGSSAVVGTIKIPNVYCGDSYRLKIDPLASQTTDNASGKKLIIGITSTKTAPIYPKMHWNDKQ